MNNPEPPNQAHSLTEHLIELRARLLKAVFTILVIFLILFSFANQAYQIMAAPLMDALPEGASMIATGVISPFFTPFKLTLYMAFILAIPVILHQIWGFIAPGLYQNEKKIAAPILISSIILFYSGMAFAYFVVFPILFQFLASIPLDGVAYMPDINDNLNLMLKLFFAFGVAFEIPIATILLIISGAVSIDSLKEKRPYVLVGCFIFGMLLTPPDIISQTLLAIPMYILFEVGILFGHLVTKKNPEDKNTENEA